MNVMGLDLLSTEGTDLGIEPLLARSGTIVRAYREQDSGCVSFVVEQASQRLFVKAVLTPAGAESLARAEALHAAVRHPALPQLLNAFSCADGPVHVYTWVPGEVLYDYVTMDGARGRAEPSSAHARFRALPISRIVDSLGVIYDLHALIAQKGFVAVDFYDGCILYDFVDHRTWVCDLDKYRPGPFVLAADRLPGSRRFMAPEESVRGATIDQRTNVFTLGRAAAILLGDGDLEFDAWRGNDAMHAALREATMPEPDARYASVALFVEAWADAVSDSRRILSATFEANPTNAESGNADPVLQSGQQSRNDQDDRQVDRRDDEVHLEGVRRVESDLLSGQR